MIPKLIHHVWPGEDPFGADDRSGRFAAWRWGWMARHPDWSFCFWRLDNLPDLGDDARKVLADPAYGRTAKSDIIRFAIVARMGGIYVDTDMECLRPLDDLLRLDLFAGWEDSRRICPSIFGAVPGHPLVVAMAEASARRALEAGPEESNRNPDRVTSVEPWTELLRNQDDGNAVLVFPPSVFFPVHYSQRESAPVVNAAERFPDSYTVHHWSGLGQDGWARYRVEQRKLDDLKGRHSGETAVILSNGPSLALFSDQDLARVCAGRTVIAIKQAVLRWPAADYHLVNRHNLEKYPVVPGQVRLAKAEPGRDMPAADLQFRIALHGKRADCLCAVRDWDRMRFEHGLDRPWGPSIIYGLGWPLVLWLGFRHVIVVGWDCVAPGASQAPHAIGLPTPMCEAAAWENRILVESSGSFAEWMEGQGVTVELLSPRSVLALKRVTLEEAVGQEEEPTPPCGHPSEEGTTPLPLCGTGGATEEGISVIVPLWGQKHAANAEAVRDSWDRCGAPKNAELIFAEPAGADPVLGARGYGRGRRVEVPTDGRDWILAAMRSGGARAARYGLLCFHDCDVPLPDGFCQQALEWAREHPAFQSFRRVRYLRPEASVAFRAAMGRSGGWAVPQPGDWGREIDVVGAGCGMSFCIRRDLYHRVGEWEELPGWGYEDILYSVRVRKALGLTTMPAALPVEIVHLWHKEEGQASEEVKALYARRRAEIEGQPVHCAGSMKRDRALRHWEERRKKGKA